MLVLAAMIVSAPIISRPIGSDCLSLREACALIGAKVDAKLANECVWTKNVTDLAYFRRQLALVVKGQWREEDKVLWLRPDPSARDAWDKVQELRDDALFAKQVQGLHPPSISDLHQAWAQVQSSPTDAKLIDRVRLMQRLTTLKAVNPEVAKALDDARLGRLGEGEARLYGEGGLAIPRRLAVAIQTIGARLEPFCPPEERAPTLGGDHVVVRRNADSYSFELRFADGKRAFETVSLASSRIIPARVSLELKPASKLFLQAFRGEALSKQERQAVDDVASAEPLRLIAREALDAEFSEEQRPIIVLLADDRLGQILDWGGVTAPKLGDDYRREIDSGWVRIAPVRLGETTRLRADRDALRKLLLRRRQSPTVDLREACVGSQSLAAVFRSSVAAPALRALWPELHRFYSENDWRWVRAVGSFRDQTLKEASNSPMSLVRTSTAERRSLRAFLGTIPTQGTLSIALESNELFRIDAAAVVKQTGIPAASTDRSPEAFGAYLARSIANSEPVYPFDLCHAESVTVKVNAEEGQANGTVVLRQMLGKVMQGDLSGIPEAIRARVRQAQTGEKPLTGMRIGGPGLP